MKVNLFTFAILLQLSLCIIATSQVNTTDKVSATDKSIQVTTAATTLVSSGVTEKELRVTKALEGTVTTVLPDSVTDGVSKKVTKKQKKEVKKSARSRKLRVTERPDDLDIDDESAEDEELVQPKIAHRARGHTARSGALKNRRQHWPRRDATYRSRTGRHHRNKPLASWRSEETSAESAKGGDDCASTIECIMKNIDPKEFCCQGGKSDDKPGAPGPLTQTPPGSDRGLPPSSQNPPPQGPTPTDPRQPNQPSPPVLPSPPQPQPQVPQQPQPQQPQPQQPQPQQPQPQQPQPQQPQQPQPLPPPIQPSPPTQTCECTCPADGDKAVVTRGQFDALKSSATYRTGLMHDAYASYNWSPYNSYNPYMARAYGYGR